MRFFGLRPTNYFSLWLQPCWIYSLALLARFAPCLTASAVEKILGEYGGFRIVHVLVYVVVHVLAHVFAYVFVHVNTLIFWTLTPESTSSSTSP